MYVQNLSFLSCINFYAARFYAAFKSIIRSFDQIIKNLFFKWTANRTNRRRSPVRCFRQWGARKIVCTYNKPRLTQKPIFHVRKLDGDFVGRIQAGRFKKRWVGKPTKNQNFLNLLAFSHWSIQNSSWKLNAVNSCLDRGIPSCTLRKGWVWKSRYAYTDSTFANFGQSGSQFRCKEQISW